MPTETKKSTKSVGKDGNVALVIELPQIPGISNKGLIEKFNTFNATNVYESIRKFLESLDTQELESLLGVKQVEQIGRMIKRALSEKYLHLMGYQENSLIATEKSLYHEYKEVREAANTAVSTHFSRFKSVLDLAKAYEELAKSCPISTSNEKRYSAFKLCINQVFQEKINDEISVKTLKYLFMLSDKFSNPNLRKLIVEKIGLTIVPET